MEGLGRVFNVVPVAEDKWIDMTACEAVSFVCVGDEAYTLYEADNTTGAASAALVTVDRYYQGQDNGVDTWTEVTQTAASTVDPNNATDDTVVVHVHGSELSSGKTALKVVNTSTGLVTAITHDLKVQRAPQNLPAVSA